MPTVAELGQKIKLKHPGSYDDIPDDQLGLKIQSKFPGAYDDFTPVRSMALAPQIPSALTGGPLPPVPTMGGEALRNLPRSIVNAVKNAPGVPVGQPAGGSPAVLHGPGGQELPFTDIPEIHPIDEIGGVLSHLYHTFRHPLESFASDPAGTALAMEMTRRGVPALPDTSGYAAAKGAAKGAVQGAMEPTTIPLSNLILGHEIKGPASLVGMTGGGLIGEIPGLGEHPILDAIAGGLLPAFRGAWRGGKAGLKEFRAAQNIGAPATPGWAGLPTPPAEMAPEPLGPLPRPTLPSGRSVGAPAIDTTTGSIVGGGSPADINPAQFIPAGGTVKNGILHDETGIPLMKLDPLPGTTPAAPPTQQPIQPGAFPSRYNVHDTTAAQQAMAKDLAIAQRLKTLKITPEDWMNMDRATQNSHVQGVLKPNGKPAYSKLGAGGARSRAPEVGVQHIAETLRELYLK